MGTSKFTLLSPWDPERKRLENERRRRRLTARQVALVASTSVFSPSPTPPEEEEEIPVPIELAVSAWYDPSDLSTLWKDTAGTDPVTADGDAVARMDDKSGNGYHLTSPNAVERPLYKTDGTLHWLKFDGVDDWMTGGDILDLGAGGLLAVCGFKYDTVKNCGIFNKAIAALAAYRYGTLHDTGEQYALFCPSYEGNANLHSKKLGYNTTAATVMAIKFDRVGGTTRLRFDGSTQAPDATHTGETVAWNTAHHFIVGAYPDGTGQAPLGGYFMDGKLYGLILKLAASPSDSDISTLETFMADKL